jgi:hypothetical protein
MLISSSVYHLVGDQDSTIHLPFKAKDTNDVVYDSLANRIHLTFLVFYKDIVSVLTMVSVTLEWLILYFVIVDDDRV